MPLIEKQLFKTIDLVDIAPRREHSRKPDEMHEMIELVSYPPRLEIFARHRRPGWDTWGNETGKFPEQQTKLFDINDVDQTVLPPHNQVKC